MVTQEEYKTEKNKLNDRTNTNTPIGIYIASAVAAFSMVGILALPGIHYYNTAYKKTPISVIAKQGKTTEKTGLELKLDLNLDKNFIVEKYLKKN